MITSKHFKVFWQQQDSQTFTRGAVIVPKKVMSLATARHTLKRQLLELLRKHSDKLQGYDLVVYVSRPSVNSTKEQLQSELITLIQKMS